jgi:hypothetical protein
VEQVETIKIAAEIELVGVKARQSAIAEIIQNGKTYNDFRNKQRSSSNLIAQLENKIADCESKIARYVAQRKAWEECPIEQGKVSIRPIKWSLPGGDPARK